jgi:hypothetical protein
MMVLARPERLKLPTFWSVAVRNDVRDRTGDVNPQVRAILRSDGQADRAAIGAEDSYGSGHSLDPSLWLGNSSLKRSRSAAAQGPRGPSISIGGSASRSASAWS